MSKLRFNELTALVANDARTSRLDTEAVLRSFGAVVNEQLHHGTSVSIPGFGIFKPSIRKARTARNPKTGEPVAVPQKQVTKFVQKA